MSQSGVATEPAWTTTMEEGYLQVQKEFHQKLEEVGSALSWAVVTYVEQIFVLALRQKDTDQGLAGARTLILDTLALHGKMAALFESEAALSAASGPEPMPQVQARLHDAAKELLG